MVGLEARIRCWKHLLWGTILDFTQWRDQNWIKTYSLLFNKHTAQQDKFDHLGKDFDSTRRKHREHNTFLVRLLHIRIQ